MFLGRLYIFSLNSFLAEWSPALIAIDYPTPVEVVRRHFHLNPIAKQHADVEPPHLAADIADQLMTVFQLDQEFAIRKGFRDHAFERNFLVFLRNRSYLLFPISEFVSLLV